VIVLVLHGLDGKGQFDKDPPIIVMDVVVGVKVYGQFQRS